MHQERETLLIGLHAELDSERARFEARKPAISEEVSLQYYDGIVCVIRGGRFRPRDC